MQTFHVYYGTRFIQTVLAWNEGEACATVADITGYDYADLRAEWAPV